MISKTYNVERITYNASLCSQGAGPLYVIRYTYYEPSDSTGGYGLC
jgi:hypothetical protein